MAEEIKASGIAGWVSNYIGDDSFEQSKPERFWFIQRLTQFGAFCYIIDKNSAKNSKELSKNYLNLYLVSHLF